MGKGEGVRSVIPVEETIIDPLYEPLKLNRYELCEHLQRLKDVSHLRYGLSPYLLFDVEGMREVVRVIRKNAELGEKESYTLYIFTTLYENFFRNFGRYLRDLNIAQIQIKKEKRNECYGYLKSQRKYLLDIFKNLKDEYQKILNIFLTDEKKEYKEISGSSLCESFTTKKFNKDNFAKISHLFRLEYPVKVKCPLCEGEKEIDPAIKPWMFMCEEGKIYSMKEALLRTFELRRARWLYMSGALHTVHRASTHTRLSHEIGSMIVAVNALYEIDVYPHDDMSMFLGEYLLMRGELHEFLMANFLHDLGHAPLSHVLEPNPFIELDHEKITRNLILGKRTEKEEEMDWYVTERYLLKMKAIKDFEYRFFENRYDPIYIDVEKKVGGELDEDKLRGYFLEYLDKNNEILESEIVTVSGVLDNFGVDKERVVEILSGKVFCPECNIFYEIKDLERESICPICGKHEQDVKKIYDTQFLNKLIDSEIDFDRIDHVKRDSVVCGLSLISFRLLELLGSMSIVLPESDVHKEIHNRDNKPIILISEDGLLYVMDLLTARRSVFRDILYSDENNWINGVVNQITALAVRYLPHLTNMLPFITDPILAHFYTNEMFLGTQIEKLNKLFHGVMDYSAYGKPMRYKLKEGVIVKDEDIKKIYRLIEDINDKYERLELPAVVFYTNIKPTKCPNCKKKTLKEPEKMLLLCPSCKKELKKENDELKCENENCNRSTIKPEEAIKVLECKCEAFSIIVDPSEDLENMFTECPFYKDKGDSKKEFCNGKMKKQEKNLIECERCKKKICKLIDESWDDMLVYGKKFGDKYYLFKNLVGKYKDALRERFPKRPCESDFKNILYIWVSDLIDKKKKKELINEIIGKVSIIKNCIDLDKVV